MKNSARLKCHKRMALLIELQPLEAQKRCYMQSEIILLKYKVLHRLFHMKVVFISVRKHSNTPGKVVRN